MNEICKVLMRLENGDDIVCTVADKHICNQSSFKKLKRTVTQKFKENLGTQLYFTVRVTIAGKKDNWRADSVEELNSILKKVFDVDEDIIQI